MGVEIDYKQLAAEMVPGVVAADNIFPGNRENMVVAAISSALLADYIKVDEPKIAKDLRIYIKQRPLLGFGAGYAVSRISGFSPAQSLVAGGAAAVVMIVVGSKKLTHKDTGTTSVGHVEMYDAMNGGDGPGGPPAAIDQDVIAGIRRV